MGKRLPIRVHMKKVIDSLREGNKTWSDLKKLGIPDKTLQRILKKNLEYFGLANKEEGYWVWSEHSMVFDSTEEYKMAVEHSKRLIPSLRGLYKLDVKSLNELHDCAKEHLRNYPEIFEKFEKFEKVFNKRIRYLLEKHGSKIRGPNFLTILDPIKVKRKGTFRFFSQTKYKRRDVPFSIRMEHPDMNYEEFKKTEEFKEVMELRDFLEANGNFTKRFDDYKDLAGKIESLCLKIEWNNPLKGVCSLCREKIKFSSEARLNTS